MRCCLKVCSLVSLFFCGPKSYGHVKWFSQFDYATPPKTLTEITTPTFWSMLALTLATLALAVWADKWVNATRPLKKIGDWFETKSSFSLLIIRVAAFATLVVAWQQGTLLTPELQVGNLWIERLQFATLLLLLFPGTTSFAGLLFLSLWGYGAWRFGLFHMLDYMNALGIGLFLILRPLHNDRLRNLSLPVLYSSVGFSLMWLACEKLVYPQWALYLLDQNPMLTLGLPPKFFLVSTAFVELGLGFLLIICLFGRSLSITITLVFFLTTCIFGKVEIIGHTLVHAALIVFLFEGAGHSFTPPALFHRTLGKRVAFATVNFAIATFVALIAYTSVAARITSAASPHVHPIYEISADTAPTIELDVTKDSMSGWNVRIQTTNFKFSPQDAGKETVAGEGHVHLYLDDQKIARVYGEWFHLVIPTAGEHTIRATLNTNDHSDYATDGNIIEASTSVTTEALTAAEKNCHAKQP